MRLSGLGRGQRWCTEEKLEVDVATICYLGDVVAGAPEGLLSTNLAPKLLVAIVGVLDVRRGHERLATVPSHLPGDVFDAEVPETAAWRLVGAKALLLFQLFLRVLNASLGAVVLVFRAVVVEGILGKVCGSLRGVGLELLVGGRRAVSLQDGSDLARLIQLVEVTPAALLGAPGVGNLIRITQETETASLSVGWQ